MDTLKIIQEGRRATITLARPEVRNAFNEVVIRELHEAFLSFYETASVVVLEGEGKAFCAGADLNWMKKSVTFSREENIKDAEVMAEMFRTIDEAPYAVVAKVNGAALGGGVGLVACADIVIASEKAKFGFTEVRLGLAPAVISPFVLAKIGESQARRYFISAEIFDAVRAQALGLVHEVVAPDALDGYVEDYVAALMKNGPRAMKDAKKLVADISKISNHPTQNITRLTAEKIAELRAGAEGQEGLAAFLEKREAKWL